MSRQARGTRLSRISPLSWIGAIAVHAVIAGLLLQFGTEPAQSNVLPRPDVEAVRVQAADEELLEQRREAHRQALREEELRKQREREAQRKEAERKKAEKRKREEEAHQKAEEKKKAKAEAKRKAKEETKRKLAEKRKREEAARRKAEEEKKRAAERAEAKRKLKEAEQRAEARRQEQVQRRQREAARRAQQAEAWRIAIKTRIERFWLQPPAAGNISPCEVVVEQDERGVVLSAKVRGCRASQAWQDSLRNAVMKASPLPRPDPADLFDRHLVITFRPKTPR